MDAGRVRAIVGWLALAALIGAAGWQGWAWWQRREAAAADAYTPVAEAAPRATGGGGEIVTVDQPTATDPNRGATPMAQRVAVVGLLNKRNGQARELTLKPGQATRIGDVIVRLKACETTAPYEQEQLTGAFVQVDVRQLDDNWRRVFSGWLYKERPALNVVLHPVYDVWTKSCAMAFPDSGPELDSIAAPMPKRSSAPKPAKSAAALPPPPPPGTSDANAADNLTR